MARALLKSRCIEALMKELNQQDSKRIDRSVRRRQRGVTLIEMMVVVAIIAITAAFAVPSIRQIQANTRLADATRQTANAFHVARQLAVRPKRNHMVFVTATSAPPATDMCAVNLPANPVVVVDDLDGDCCIDANEIVYDVDAVNGVFWGTLDAARPNAPDDPGAAGGRNFADGTTFQDPAGGAAYWMMIRPDGMPISVSNGCNPGPVGSGGGGVYLNNGTREYSVVLTTLGGVKSHGFEQGEGAWSD